MHQAEPRPMHAGQPQVCRQLQLTRAAHLAGRERQRHCGHCAPPGECCWLAPAAGQRAAEPQASLVSQLSFLLLSAALGASLWAVEPHCSTPASHASLLHTLSMPCNALLTISASFQMGYAHVGNAIYLTGEGRVEVVMNSTQRLGEGLGVSDLTPVVRASVAAAVAAKVREWLGLSYEGRQARQCDIPWMHARMLCFANAPFHASPNRSKRLTECEPSTKFMRRCRSCCLMWPPQRSKRLALRWRWRALQMRKRQPQQLRRQRQGARAQQRHWEQPPRL